MGRLGLMLFVLTIFKISMCTVRLHIRFLMDVEYNFNISNPDAYDVLRVTPDVIWRHLVKSKILRRKFLAPYTTEYGSCDLDGMRKMMLRNFTAKDISKVHGFIGPMCMYGCDITGMITSVYSIPQVSGFISKHAFESLPLHVMLR